jgi:hypothetical protein
LAKIVAAAGIAVEAHIDPIEALVRCARAHPRWILAVGSLFLAGTLRAHLMSERSMKQALEFPDGSPGSDDPELRLKSKASSGELAGSHAFESVARALGAGMQMPTTMKKRTKGPRFGQR